MEILGKQAAIAPCLHHSVAVACSGSSSPTATTAVSGSSCNRRQCRASLPVLPKITFVPQCRAMASALERKQTHCRRSRSSVGDGLARVYRHAQQFASCREVRALSRAESRGNFSGTDHAPISVKVGAFRERFELVCRVARVYHHAQQLASCRGGRELSRGASLGSFSGTHHAPVRVRVGAFRERFELVCRVIHFMKCSRPRWPVAKSSMNGGFSNGEGNVDIELELFRFMQQSSKPDVFPTRQDLISAGRLDLATAIVQEGGWLAAGWDEVETSSTGFSGENVGTDGKGSASARREKGSSRKRSTRKLKARSVKRSSTARNSSRMATVAIDERTHESERGVNGSNVVREVVNAVDHKDGRKKGNERTMLSTDGELFEDLSIMEGANLPFEGDSAVHETKTTSRPSNDDLQVLERLESLFSFTEELKLKRPLKGYTWGQGSARNGFLNGTMKTTVPSNFLDENYLQPEAQRQVPAENSLLNGKDATVVVDDPPQRKRSPRKKGRPKIVNSESIDELNGTSDWIHKISDRREKWMFDTRSKSGENSFAASLVVDSKSTENRIQTLAAKLVDTRAELQSVSEELWNTGNADDEERNGALSEFIDAEDTLEFRENAIMHARNELNTTRAQVAALEGNLKVEIMEARKILEEKNREVERTRSISQRLRTARIVWPNSANEVYLTGSFNGWNSQVKMEKSSAGVFTCSLPLYPGKYEIKFVVDGSWSVDTRRPIVYVGGFENNVLTVS